MKLPTLLALGDSLVKHEREMEPWLLQEIQPHGREWLQGLEEQSDLFGKRMLETLPVLYRLFAPLEAEERTARLRERVLRGVMRLRMYREALAMLQSHPEPDPMLVAECREGLGELEAAADEYLRAGRKADALRCYRGIPDFDKTLALLGTLDKHPAQASLEWLQRMRALAAERPAEFSKVLLPAEKKLLEQVLEASLGVARKKPAAKSAKPAVRKPGPPKKSSPKVSPRTRR